MSRVPLLMCSAVALVAAACSDPGTAPTANQRANVPASSKAGTLGNPKFADQATNCVPGEPVPDGTTHIGCSYKITGGGNTASATVNLSAPVLFSGECRNHGGTIVPVKDFALTISTKQANVQFQNGEITGTIAVDLSQANAPSASQVCPNGNWTVIPRQFAFAGRYELSALIASGSASVTIVSAFTL